MSRQASATLLQRLCIIKADYGTVPCVEKLALLSQLKTRRLGAADEILRLHDTLCFLRAYPDNADVLFLVETLLADFTARSDLKRFRTVLAGSALPGTIIDYSFFWPMAQWIAKRWPEHFAIDWPAVETSARLKEIVPLLSTYGERSIFDEFDLSPREAIERLKGAQESDATFVVRRIGSIYADDFERETLHDALDLPYRLRPNSAQPLQSLDKYPCPKIAFQRGPLQRKRPDLRVALTRRPRSVRSLSPRAAEKILDLARAAMVLHHRDLDAFSYGYNHDVRLVDCGGGLQFACIGMQPQRRYLLPVVYGFLNLKNGVPVGYFQTSEVYRSIELSFNTFTTFRGAEAAQIYAHALAMTRHLFDVDEFALDPYQLGAGNKEGLESGVWWFYYKLGFRPREPKVQALANEELRKMQRNRSYRSNVAILEKLASEYMYLNLNPRRKPVDLPVLCNIGFGLADYLAREFGAARESGIRECSRHAARLLDLTSLRGFSRDERQAWLRWAPLVVNLSGIDRWTGADKRAAVAVIRAKGGRSEEDFLKRFDRHRPLQRAILRFAKQVD